MERFAQPLARGSMPGVSNYVDFPQPENDGDSLFEQPRPSPSQASLGGSSSAPPPSSSSSSSRRSERRVRSDASGSFDYRVAADPYLAPSLAISTAVDAAARRLIDETAHLLSGPGQGQAVERVIRQVAPGILTTEESVLRFEEINLLRQYVDELGRRAEETPLALFVNMVVARASAYATDDLLIQQSASRRLGITRINPPSPLVTTRTVLETLNLGEAVQDLESRLREREVSLRDRLLFDLAKPPPEIFFVSREGGVSSSPTRTVSQAALEAVGQFADRGEVAATAISSTMKEAADVFKDITALRAVSPVIRAATNEPRVDPRVLLRLNAATASPADLTLQDAVDAADIADQAERAVRSTAAQVQDEALPGIGAAESARISRELFVVAEKFLEKTNYIRSITDINAPDSPFNPNVQKPAVQAANARANVNINVDAGGVLDAQQLQALLEDTRLERQQELETALTEQIRSANNIDRKQEKERDKYLNALVGLLSNPVLTGQERPSSRLLGAMGLAMSRIVAANPTFKPIATRRRYEVLYANRDGIVTAQFAEAVASILLESGSFSRYQSQMSTRTAQGLGTAAFNWFHLAAYYDGRRVQLVPEGETTETLGIVSWRRPRRRPTISDRLAGLQAHMRGRRSEILVRHIESVTQQPRPGLAPIPSFSLPPTFARRR